MNATLWDGLSVEEVIETYNRAPLVAGPWVSSKLSSGAIVWMRVGVRHEIRARIEETTADPDVRMWLAHVPPGGYHEWSTVEMAKAMCDRLLQAGGYRLG